MSGTIRCFALGFSFALVSGGQVFAQMTAAPSENLRQSFAKISREEIGFLLADVPPGKRKELLDLEGALLELQLTELRELFIYTQQAVREGIADKQEVAAELDWIALEQKALSYDREIGKKAKVKPKPLAWVTAARVKTFLAKPEVEEAVQLFLDNKLALLERTGEATSGDELTDEAKRELRNYYARVNLAAETADLRSKAFGPVYQRKVAFRTRLQQAQLLARLYTDENILDVYDVTDEEIEAYLKEHPGLDKRAEKRAKAEEILRRVLAGEDMSKLAAEFSEDPGSKARGGLYRGVKPGVFLPAFEEAADLLQPGETAKELVETDFGYHIIKLEKRGTAKDEVGEDVETFDVRHILFATTVDDPDSIDGQPKPLNEWVKDKITTGREEARLAELTKNNPVVIEWP